MESTKQIDLSKLSEQSMLVLAKDNLLSYHDFCVEIKRRMDVGKYVHPYHAKCAKEHIELLW